LDFVLLVIFEPSGWDIEPCDSNAGIETLEECIFELLLSGQSRQSFLHLSHLVDVERNHGHPIGYFSRHFLLLIYVRQRTDKEAVAAGLFAVLGRKRAKVSGQVREEPDQFGCLRAVQRFHYLFVAALLSPLLARQKTNKEFADSLL
jgi:hypothetical protein